MDFPQCLLFIIIPILDARSWIKPHENNFIIDFYFIARIMHRITYHTRTHIHNQKWPLLWARANYNIFLSAIWYPRKQKLLKTLGQRLSSNNDTVWPKIEEIIFPQIDNWIYTNKIFCLPRYQSYIYQVLQTIQMKLIL